MTGDAVIQLDWIFTDGCVSMCWYDRFHCFYLSKEGILFAGIETSILGFKIIDNNIELISYIQNAHKESENGFRVIQSITEGLNKEIISTSYDGTIKIWIQIINN